MRIVQVSTSDSLGGAEIVAYNLHHSYRTRGYSAWLTVGRKRTDDPYVLPIANHVNSKTWTRICLYLENVLSSFVGKGRTVERLRKLFHLINQPNSLLEMVKGHEDFEFPSTWQVLNFPPERPDIIHCHNLHGSYFDLRVLPWLSQQVPVVLTLHDEWLLSGHCSYTLGCERWKIGCGQCPDLKIYPAIRRDATAYNWQRKQKIYSKCRLYLATPSQWLMHKVEKSTLATAVKEARLIPNGVDLSVFHPQDDRREIRSSLDIPLNARVLLFTAHGIRTNMFKDYETIRSAVALATKHLDGQNLIFIALGEHAPIEKFGKTEVRSIPYENDPVRVARYYQAADIFVHAAHADTFPNTVLESLACGTPVVATAVGGIPEQVKGLGIPDCRLRNSDLNIYGIDEATGVLVTPGNADAMAFGVEYLLRNDSLLHRIGQNAAEDACQRFDLQRQVDHYLEWYSEILEHHATKPL